MNDKVASLRGAEANLTEDQRDMLAAIQRVREAVLADKVASIFVLMFDHEDEAMDPEVEGAICIDSLHYNLHVQMLELAKAGDD